MQRRQFVHRGNPRDRTGRCAAILATAFAVVFMLGALIGYNSVYRNISVAMLAAPPAGQL